MAKDQTRKRHLDKEVENKRLLEIEEHYTTFNTNEHLRKQFDYILYNNYDKESEEQIIKLVENILNK